MRRTVTTGLLVFALGAAVASATSWTPYHNDRFGTTADRPADWIESPPPANGDGQEFTSADGKAKLTVSGISSVGTAKEEVAGRLRPQDGETISYRASTGTLVVVSGIRGDTIFYRKSLASCGGRIWNTVSFEYPTADKALYDEIVAHIAGSLRPGAGSQADGCG